MSMLSAQIDELRVMAQLEKNLERPAIARILGDAADTIWELRDDLQRANDNLQDAEHDESRAWDRVRKAEAVADKLRKLAQRMWRLERFGCCGCRQECDAESCYASDCKEAIEIEQEMRDLGIEVPR